ncbi:MAG: AAA family ATPase, partial [Limisphaerales bacterium]
MSAYRDRRPQQPQPRGFVRRQSAALIIRAAGAVFRASHACRSNTALDALLSSTNTVSVFRGGAGTGKSYVLRELVEQLRQADRSVVVLAPQRQQVVDMEMNGFLSPSTVASFLVRGELAERAIVVVDEAGQIGGRQMQGLLRLVKEHNARIVLSGDTRQHGAVEASDALLAIERHGGVKPVELQKIRRQDPALG